jgi:predicted AAA+ superfamily ATPase
VRRDGLYQLLLALVRLARTLVARRVDEEPSAYHFVPAVTIPSSDTSWIPQQWNNARLQLKRSNQDDFVLVIDEIQKISHWSGLIKREP